MPVSTLTEATTTRNSSVTVHVTIKRSDDSRQRVFDVPRIEPMMVLDLLLSIQREQDPSIGFRYSCRVGMCGTCTLRMDGRSVLACQTRLEHDRDDVRLDPLSGLPVVRDLIVDTKPFFDEWARVTPYLVPRDGLDSPAVVRPDSRERRAIDPALDCINCAACYSGCGIAESRRDFIGPAALNRAMTLIMDSRDGYRAERLRTVTGDDGAWRCRYIHACTAMCPKGLDPAGAIRRLRRLAFNGLRDDNR